MKRKRTGILGISAIILLVAVSCGIYYLFAKNKPAPGPMIDGKPGYDVIVVGGEPEGVAAALSAARNGMKTLLVEDDEALGGLMTLGRLNFLDMNHGPQGELLTRGIFQEIYDVLGNAFDVTQAKELFREKVEKEKNITLLLNTSLVEPLMDGKEIVGVKVEEEGVEKEYLSLCTIDATVDADVAAAAGVPYTVGGEDYGEEGLLMGVTLVFEVKGVDWDRVIQYLKREDDDPHSGADQVAAWGYGKEAMGYVPHDEQMRFRGPNLARQDDGNVLINALLIFGVDSLDEESRQLGIERGKKEIPYIIEFMREKFPGFAEVEFVDTAEELYVRETRHIQGEYRLSITDVLENRDQWDRIGHGSYPVDVQPTGPENFGNVIGKPAIYSIPFRCLVPLEIDGLLVVGRSASYDSLPHGSARVIPVGMTTGEAAGVACAYAVENEVTFRQMTAEPDAIQWVQEGLKKQGAYLVEYEPPRPEVMEHWAYPGVKVMRELGLIEGGYVNDYGLERRANKWNIENKLNKVLRLAHERNEGVELRRLEVPLEVTRRVFLEVVAEGLTGKKMDYAEALDLLKEAGIVTPFLEKRFAYGDEAPDFGEMLTVLANLYNHLMDGKV